MIEKFSKEELEQIIKEIGELGIQVKVNHKGNVINEEGEAVFGSRPYIGCNFRKPILKIADSLTNNFEKKNSKTYARKDVPEEINEKYREIVRGILNVMKPYYGSVMGFRPGRWE